MRHRFSAGRTGRGRIAQDPRQGRRVRRLLCAALRTPRARAPKLPFLGRPPVVCPHPHHPAPCLGSFRTRSVLSVRQWSGESRPSRRQVVHFSHARPRPPRERARSPIKAQCARATVTIRCGANGVRQEPRRRIFFLSSPQRGDPRPSPPGAGKEGRRAGREGPRAAEHRSRAHR